MEFSAFRVKKPLQCVFSFFHFVFFAPLAMLVVVVVVSYAMCVRRKLERSKETRKKARLCRVRGEVMCVLSLYICTCTVSTNTDRNNLN